MTSKKSIHKCSVCNQDQHRNNQKQIVCEKNCRFLYPNEWKEKERERLLSYWKEFYKKNKIHTLEVMKKNYKNNKERINKRQKEWLQNQPPEYKVWMGMIARCTIASNGSYYRYGGRGIAVCDRWRHSYDNFFIDMGPRPSPDHSIERENVNGNYEPSNCFWATAKQQANNRTNTVSNRLGISDLSPIIHEGRVLTIKEFSDLTQIPFEVVKYRYTQHAVSDWIIESDVDNRYYEYKGHKYNMVELALLHSEPFGKLSYIQMSQRIKKYGWSVERSVETPYR